MRKKLFCILLTRNTDDMNNIDFRPGEVYNISPVSLPLKKNQNRGRGNIFFKDQYYYLGILLFAAFISCLFANLMTILKYI